MDADDAVPNRFEGSFLLEAFRTYFRYVQSAEDLVHLTHEGLGRVQDTPELFRALDLSPEAIERAEWKAGRAKREIESGFPTLHAHSLLGLFGALEYFAEDIVIAAIHHDPSLLATEAFARIKLPVAMVVGGDSRDRDEAIIAEASRSTNSDLSGGVAKFERLLALVGLDGPVPREVRKSIFVGQQIRNVWAHRGGLADKRFIDACPDLGYTLGERVNMNAHQFMPLMHGIHMYGVVIINRHLDALGRARLDNECQGYNGCLTELPEPPSLGQ